MLHFESLESRDLLSAVSYFGFEDFELGNSWKDAEKSPLIADDNSLCWAGAASNVLSWGGWGVEDWHTEDEIFSKFIEHSANTGGLVSWAYKWWLNGSESTIFEPGTGNFWPEDNFSRIADIESVTYNSMSEIHRLLKSGYGVAISIAGPGSHAVTAWGVEYDDVTGEYTGIWVSDSDDNKTIVNPPDMLRYFRVEKEGLYYYLRNYFGYNTWRIHTLSGLLARPETVLPPANGTITGTISGLTQATDVFLDINNNSVQDNNYAEFISVIHTDFPPRPEDRLASYEYHYLPLQIDTEITTITDLNIKVDLECYSSNGISIWLEAPNGYTVPVMSRVGGFTGDLYQVRFDDSAEAKIWLNESKVATGDYQTYFDLSNFNGLNPNGEWNLVVYNKWDYPVLVNSWGLEISEVEPVVNTDSSFEFTNLPEGYYNVVVNAPNLMYAPTTNVYDHILSRDEDWHTNLKYKNLDKNNDGRIGSYELDLIRAYWGTYSEERDIDGDGIVNSRDLDIIRMHWI